MGKCYYCGERDRVGFWTYYCEDCANLRRMLLIYEPKKCTDILKRTLTRDDSQISYKIQQEVKKIVLTDLQKKVDNKINDSDESYEKPKTRGDKAK